MFIVLLLLIVVFLSGILIGIDREKKAMTIDLQEEMQPFETSRQIFQAESIDQFQQNEQLTDRQIPSDAIPQQTTQKMASFLEAGVKGFYEAVVEILYQISSLFI